MLWGCGVGTWGSWAGGSDLITILHCRELNHDAGPVNEQKSMEKALRMRTEPQFVSRIKIEKK